MKLVDISTKKYPNTFAMVDDQDFDEVNSHKWHLFKTGELCYARGFQNYKKRFLHNLIMKAEKGQYIDHINGNGLDNRKENLRICTISQNNSNNRRSAGISGYRGVRKSHGGSGWEAILKHERKHYCLGTFADPKDAAAAWNKKALELKGEFACLNKI